MDDLKQIAPGKQNNAANALRSTQVFLKFGEIRENILILKNGGARAIIKTSSINFNLKSEEEQNAIIYSYQNFLNSLEFPIQIVVRSKKLDLDDYIEQVKGLAQNQKNQLLKQQTEEYAQYIKRLIDYADIMEKKFYVVVPYNPGRAQNTNAIQKFFQSLAPKDSYVEIKKRHSEFENTKKNLIQRVQIIKSGLENCGLAAEQLNTQEIIELFYNSYNPTISRSSKIKNINNSSIMTDEEFAQDLEKNKK